MAQLLERPRIRQFPVNLDTVEHVLLEDVSWATYESLLREIGDRPIRMTYDEGRLEILSPLFWHEATKKFIARLIQMLTLDLDILVKSLGSPTFRRREIAKGLEPDECYFLKHEKQMRGNKRWNPKSDPVPDLVLEVDITHRSIKREPIYAKLGVPELWRYDSRRLDCLELIDGEYVVREKSIAFPFLVVNDLMQFVKLLPTQSENEIIKRFRKWVKAKARGNY